MCILRHFEDVEVQPAQKVTLQDATTAWDFTSWAWRPAQVCSGRGDQGVGDRCPHQERGTITPRPGRENTAKATRVLQSLCLLSFSCVSRSNYIYKVTAFSFSLFFSKIPLLCSVSGSHFKCALAARRASASLIYYLCLWNMDIGPTLLLTLSESVQMQSLLDIHCIK